MTYTNNATSEWFDVQVKYKNYLPKEEEPDKCYLEKIVREVIENYDPMENKKLEELEDMEDNFGLEDDIFIKQYKDKRIAEIKEKDKADKFGQMREIRYDDYKREVNMASKDCWVVLLLHQEYIEISNILGRILQNQAIKFPHVKFLKIQATNCIPGMKDKDVPALIIYKDEKVFKQFFPAPVFFGGREMNWKKVEWILHSLGIVKSELESDPFDSTADEDQRGFFTMKKLKKNKRDDESDSEEEENRPNRWKI
jgi:hypothetical protein